MDRERFDALARVLATAGSRRGALGTLLGLAALGGGIDALAKKGGKGRNHGGKSKNRNQKKRRQKERRAREQAAPARCFTGAPCIPGPGANLASCDFEGTNTLAGQNLSGSNLSKANLQDADASGAKLNSANLGGACLVDANLTGATTGSANFTGAIFCRTRMPNGTINNSGCNKGTRCCPTCVPVNDDGCNLGGSCCGGAVCTGGGDGVCTCPSGTILCPDGNCRGCCSVDDCEPIGDICNANGQCRCGMGPVCTGDNVCESGQCVLKVSPADLKGWFFYQDTNSPPTFVEGINNSLGSFVTGPGNPPLGDGSAQISTTGLSRPNLATYQFSGTPLADITQLKFRTYNPSAGNGGPANRSAYLHFNVDFNGSDTWQRRLVFVPRLNGTVIQDTWQQWDAINAGAAQWSYSGPTWPVDGLPGTTLKSWNQIVTQYPGIRIRVTDAFLGLRVGEPYPDGYTENIDSFTFGTSSGVKIFDFEPNP
jgi:uncharacterized protein YjbI with pentapeptide repeats